LDLTKELSEFVGFKVIETLTFKLVGNRFARHHDIKGHNHDLWHEYAVVLRKKGKVI
jgi:hypothetical protein